jgi:branched-chain amino acid transport system permease protein
MTTIGQLVFSGLLIGSIYALMSMGLTLIFGVLRVVNFAHGEFLMIAMYGAWAMTRYLKAADTGGSGRAEKTGFS